MVVGLLKDPETAEEALNNLSEAEFNLQDISIIAKDKHIAKQIADPAGPFKELKPLEVGSQLENEGIARDLANAFQERIDKGGIFIAIAGDPAGDDVAEEMLKDNGADPVVIIPS